VDERAIAAAAHPVGADRLDPDVVAGRDLQRDVAGDDLERLADLRGDRVADLGRIGDVVEVAAAGVGDGLEQVLVEIVARPRRSTSTRRGPELGGVVRQLVGVGDPDVREPVGQQEAAVDAALGQVARDLLAAAEPALAEVRAAACFDLAQPVDRGTA
jgi:hypothetical protein